MFDITIKKIVGKAFKPRPEFLKRSETVFLAAFTTKFPAVRTVPQRTWPIFAKGMIAGVALMATVGGASVFADTQNVPPDHILYPLKRSYESVSAIMTAGEAQAPLYAKMAERRLEEIRTLGTEDPGNVKIRGLASDLKKDLKKSFGTAETPMTAERAQPASYSKVMALPATAPAMEAYDSPEPPLLSMEKESAACSPLRKMVESDEPEIMIIMEEENELQSMFYENCR